MTPSILCIEIPRKVHRGTLECRSLRGNQRFFADTARNRRGHGGFAIRFTIDLPFSSRSAADDYFHAVLEDVKSVADKIRQRTGQTDDGATLIDRTLGGSPPLAINSLATESERSERKGFANLVRGTFGMFRNPPAHAALTIVSLIHRRIDSARMPPRV
jgi:uncharacterized protein (TIGR02391 family)